MAMRQQELFDNEKSLTKVINTVSKEKNIDKSIIIKALEQAMIHAALKTFGPQADLEAHYNEELDEVELFQFRTVVEDDDVANEVTEIALNEAKKLDNESNLGDSIGVKVDTSFLGRIAAQSAKQIIIQKVREAERMQIYEEFKDKVGEILSGYVRRFEHNDIIVDLGKTEAIIPSNEQIPTEKFRVKDRIQGLVLEVKKSSRGPQIVLSRAHPGFLVALFEQVVTEIYDGIVTIESAARDPGYRSKIAVYSKDSSVDPVGSCVGIKGQRVQSVVQELNGEKIDIIQWDRDPAKLVCNALAPAVVSKVIVDEAAHSMEVIVPEDQLSLAIGKKGQNVRLAAQLTGWKLDIKSETKLEKELSNIKKLIASIPGVGDIKASILVYEGIAKPEDLAAMNPRIVSRILNISVEEAETIINNAKNYDPSTVELDNIDEDLSEETKELLANASATPKTNDLNILGSNSIIRSDRIEMFLKLPGVGEAAATALAEAGYAKIGDILADSSEELAQKTGLPISIVKTIQKAADKYLQEESQELIGRKED